MSNPNADKGWFWACKMCPAKGDGTYSHIGREVKKHKDANPDHQTKLGARKV